MEIHKMPNLASPRVNKRNTKAIKTTWDIFPSHGTSMDRDFSFAGVRFDPKKGLYICIPKLPDDTQLFM